MGAIFLSYSRDDRPCAEALARVLDEAGHEVWWDRRIDSGEEFATEIEAALEKADVVLVAWSAHSGKSPWVRDEAAAGRDNGRLLPVTIDGSPPPMGFRQFQTLDLTGWKGAKRDGRTAELLRCVERRLKGKERSGRTAPHLQGSQQALRDWKGWRWTVAAALLVVIGAAAAISLLRIGPARAEPASLAVLPFKNMSAGAPYFAEGVAEEISDQLAREPQLRVTGRTSASLFKDAADLRAVGRKLNVAYVLEGSVRSAGQQVRVDVSLVETRKGVRLWSQDFHGTLNDILAIQDNIGQQVAAHVRRQLIQSIARPSIKTSGEVYTLYVTARSLMHQREPSKIDAAIALLRRAVSTDPKYAPAWAQLALALGLKETYDDEENGPFASEQERLGYAERAVSLAPALAEGHAVLGLLLLSNEKLDAAKMRRGRAELENALRLNPNDSECWLWLHYARLDELDFDGALDALRRSARIDPFFFIVSEHLPLLAWDMGYREEAIRALNYRIDNHPDPFISQMARVELAELQNDRSSAYEYAKKAREIALPDVRPVAEAQMGGNLLQLRLLDQAERFVPPHIVDMWRGKFTFPNGARGAFPHALDYWRYMDANGAPHMQPRLLVKVGRSRDIVAFYDEAFPSPEDMAARYSNPGFIEMAPMLAISLQQAGRVNEGARVLLLGDAMCRRGVRNGHSPRSFRVSCSRVSALLGHKDLAIDTLERAIAEGWRPAVGEFAAVSDEPAYVLVRNDPRIKRIDATLEAEGARERRELLSAGI